MATNVWTPRWSAFLSNEQVQHRPRKRPIPIRIRTFSESAPRSPGYDDGWNSPRSRHKSAVEASDVSPRQTSRSHSTAETSSKEAETFPPSVEHSTPEGPGSLGVLTPPTSPLTRVSTERTSLDSIGPEVIPYDFSKIDYEIERAKVLGHGLWSVVYLAEQKQAKPSMSDMKTLTPPNTPDKSAIGVAPSLFAIKYPSRQDAKDIFRQEAKVLSRLHRKTQCTQFVVSFYGLDERNDSLVFEAVVGGSLESLTSRLKQMTEVARHLELISIFPGIADDLISGLDFLHSSGVVHADIKPGNVLLDISEQVSQPAPVIRARYIDFSAAFMPDEGDSAANAGGTWDFMAPEQLRLQKELNTPTPASDVWSLGISLLSIIVGGSPYTAACGDNLFRLREGIKAGDPLGYARMDPVIRKRLDACQDFVDCCRLALKKDRENRVSAAAWKAWMEEQQMNV